MYCHLVLYFFQYNHCVQLNLGHCNYLREDDIKRGPLMGYSHNIISTFYTTTSEQKTRVIHFNDPPGKLFRIIYSILVTSIFACINKNQIFWILIRYTFFKFRWYPQKFKRSNGSNANLHISILQGVQYWNVPFESVPVGKLLIILTGSDNF